jgi:aromatic ring hydroxylase
MGLRTGADYLAALKDGRQIIHEGRLIEDVTSVPGFGKTARAVAQYYEFQRMPELQDVMTYVAPDGERAGISFLEARSPEDLTRRMAGAAAWAEVTCGFMGRSPDYMNGFITEVGASRHALAKVGPDFAERAYAIYVESRTKDLCHTHTFAEPYQVNSPTAPPRFTIVRETPEGIVVRGARGIATLAPFADRNINMPGVPHTGPDGVPFTLCFSGAVSNQRLRWLCRDVLSPERSHFDAPLSGRLDEMDCVGIFDDCLIPWSDIFAWRRGPEAMTPLPFMSRALAVAQHYTTVRAVAKTRFLIGLAHLLAESSQVSQFINIKERLGEMVFFLRAMESFASDAVTRGIRDPETGGYYPNPQVTSTAAYLYTEFHKRMVDHLLDIGAGRYISTPQEATFEHLGTAIEDHFRGASGGGSDAVALHRLAWDVAGSSWGSRHALYERFHFGDSTLRKAGAYVTFDKTEVTEMVRRLLNGPARESEVFPTSGTRR